MANIQKTLDALQPYVIGIRYLDGTPIVDAVFKDGWTLPESNFITKAKGNEELNYYMLFSDKDTIGLDELLEYVETTIKVNIEKEKKHELLKDKVNELKELFKKTSLTKLQRLKFLFADEDLTPPISELDIEEPEEVKDTVQLSTVEKEEPILAETENKHIEDEPVNDDEREIIEEEKRAEAYRLYQENKKNNQSLENIKKKVELPPKKISDTINEISNEECDCSPDEACSKCIDKKSL